MAEGNIKLNGRDIELVFNFWVMTQFKRATGIGSMERLQEVLTDVEHLPLLLWHMAGGAKAEKNGENPPVAWWAQNIDFTNYEKILDTVTDITLGNSEASQEEEPKKKTKKERETP
tara:strand:+ start:222 stop:569 length:348 start_codon:yes stop_codon:yes gene_type:complete